MSLFKKLTLSFIFSIIISIFIISIISNTMINNRFDNYLKEEQNMKFEKIYNDINQLFIEKGNELRTKDIDNYTRNEGVYIEIRGSGNNFICHSNTKPGRKMMGNMMQGHHKMMREGLPNDGNYVEKTFPLLDKDKFIGTLIIGYIDNSYLTESAIIFKSTLSKSFIISAIITIILGFIISVPLSKGLTTPILNITNTANQMRGGDLESRSIVETNVNEISELSSSINYLAETLQKQEDLRRRYASDISHELRTPLTTLKAHLEAMTDGIWDITEENLSLLIEEIDGLNKLVEDLKNTFSDLEGELILNKTCFNISKELENIVLDFKPLFDKNNYLLEYSIEDNIKVSMDKYRFKQIMNNLLSNALKYLNENGKVIVSMKKEANFIKIIVEDNGTGINKEDLPFIFERFYRSDVSRNRETGGTGLGLSIVKTLVEAHGSEVYVESEINKGTKFTILLPI